MRILLLGLNYQPELIGTALYTSDMTKRLVEMGHDVTCVVGQPYYPQWKVFDGHSRFFYKTDVAHGAPKVVRCPHYVPQTPTGARRVLHHASFALTALPVMAYQAVRHRPDVVISIAPALVSSPVAWIAARLGRAKTWLHIQDLEVDAAFSTGLLKEHSRVGRLARRFENWLLAKFDRVSTISKPMMGKLTDKGVSKDRQYELRNWADLSQVQVHDGPSPMKAELGLTAPRIVLYSGNLANKQGLEILPAAARTLTHRPDIHFLICGEGSALARLKADAAGLDSITFLPLQAKDKLGALLGVADVHVLPQIAGAADLVLPSKLTNMLASGRPVVATTDPGTALAHEVEGAGLITPPGDADALASAITRLIDDPEMRKTFGQTAREHATTRWDGKSILGSFEQALYGLCKSDRP